MYIFLINMFQEYSTQTYHTEKRVHFQLHHHHNNSLHIKIIKMYHKQKLLHHTCMIFTSFLRLLEKCMHSWCYIWIQLQWTNTINQLHTNTKNNYKCLVHQNITTALLL